MSSSDETDPSIASGAKAVVSTVVRVGPPFVELQGGRRVRLDPADSHAPGFAQVLGELCKQRRPVYLELDPATSTTIRRLLIPLVVRVTGIRAADGGGFDVKLAPSAARHRLRPSAPDFVALERQLRAAMGVGAPVLVTADEAQDIIHVREFKEGPDGNMPPLPPSGS